MKVFNKFITKHKLTRQDRKGIITKACKLGRVDILEFGETIWNGMGIDLRQASPVIIACEHNRVNILRYLHEEWEFTADDVRINRNAALWQAASRGHLEVLRFLHDAWHLTTADARRHNNRALNFAARNVHIDCLQYLHDAYGLTTEDAWGTDGSLFFSLSTLGYASILRHFHDVWGFTAEMARSYNNRALRGAAKHRHVEVLRVLHDAYDLTSEDARANDNEAIRNATQFSQMDVLTYLYYVWNLTSADARVVSSEVLLNARSHIRDFFQFHWPEAHIRRATQSKIELDETAARSIIVQEFINSVPELENPVSLPTCSICLKELVILREFGKDIKCTVWETSMTRTACRHWFHSSCIQQVLITSKGLCPLCRREIMPEKLKIIEMKTGDFLPESFITLA